MAPSTINGSQPFLRAQFDLVGSSEILKSQAIRSIPDLIRFNAERNPTHTFCLQAQKLVSGQNFKFKSVSFFKLEEAVRGCCEWIVSNIDGTVPAALTREGPIKKSRPVALLMESDICLFIYVAALLSINVPVGHPYL
jgi:hypothetical protein